MNVGPVAPAMSANAVLPPLFCCHWNVVVEVVVPSGSTIGADEAVTALPWVGVESLIEGPAFGAVLVTMFAPNVTTVSLTVALVETANSAVLAPVAVPRARVTVIVH